MENIKSKTYRNYVFYNTKAAHVNIHKIVQECINQSIGLPCSTNME